MHRTWQWLLIVILLTAAVWRFADLERDPPLVSWTATDWSDPGLYLYPARSFLLFGDWRPSEAAVLSKAPGYVLASVVWCEVFGYSYAHAVLLALFSGFITIAAVGVIARNLATFDDHRASPNVAGIAALVSLLLSYIWFGQQMVPRADMESIAIAALTAMLFTQAEVHRRNGKEARARQLIFFAGLGCGLAPFMKNNQIVFTTAALTGWIGSYFVLDQEWKAFWRKSTRNLTSGLLASGILWAGWILWMYSIGALRDLPLWLEVSFGGVSPVITRLFVPESMSPKIALQSMPFVPGRFFESNLLYRQPVETFLCIVTFCRLLLDRKRWNWPTILILNWIFLGVVIMSFLEYNPIRFRILFLPPAFVLAACQWNELRLGLFRMTSDTRRAVLIGVTGAITGYVAIQLTSNHFLSSELVPLGGLLFSEFVIFSLFLASTTYLALFWLRPRTLSLVLTIVFFGVTIPQWIKGEVRHSHELRDIGHYIETKYHNAILSGGWAPEIGLWTKLDVYTGSPWTPEAMRKVTLVVDESVNIEVTDPPPLPWQRLENLELPAIKHHLEIVGILR